MRGRRILTTCLLAAGVMATGSGANVANDQVVTPELARQRNVWVEESLNRMETIKVGMTRADLFKVFTGEGGLYSRTTGHYVLRDCPLFKVDVEFEPAGSSTSERTAIEYSDADVIKTISRPYIEHIHIN